jgi:glycosyltransferase involved in cell wall biosynthesis
MSASAGSARAPSAPAWSAQPPLRSDGSPRPLRTAALGISTAPICGVRDHATLLADALADVGCPCSTHWLERRAGTLRDARAEVRAWTSGLAGELGAARADAALLHYSVFAFAFRGVPIFVRPTLAAVRRARLPLVTILHEFVYPWGRDGLRGAAWAMSQRALLVEAMRSSDAIVTTTDFQAAWLASRPWLPKRPIAVAPVFSNLPAPSAQSPAADEVDRAVPTIGLFGYTYGESTIALVLDALRRLRERGAPARLELLGAPGSSAPGGAAWVAAARALGLTEQVSFSGTLAPQALSDALASCELLLFVDPIGPNSRKTTLAASLAAGRAVVALDGPRRWRELLDADAARVVAPTSQALADELRALLGDAERRGALGARARAFAQDRMSATRAAGVIADRLAVALSRRER